MPKAGPRRPVSAAVDAPAHVVPQAVVCEEGRVSCRDEVDAVCLLVGDVVAEDRLAARSAGDDVDAVAGARGVRRGDRVVDDGDDARRGGAGNAVSGVAENRAGEDEAGVGCGDADVRPAFHPAASDDRPGG